MVSPWVITQLTHADFRAVCIIRAGSSLCKSMTKLLGCCSKLQVDWQGWAPPGTVRSWICWVGQGRQVSACEGWAGALVAVRIYKEVKWHCAGLFTSFLSFWFGYNRGSGPKSRTSVLRVGALFLPLGHTLKLIRQTLYFRLKHQCELEMWTIASHSCLSDTESSVLCL